PKIAARLLETHFPESIHADILSAVGLILGVDKAAAKKRDPQFRQRVLTAYEYRCAVCGFDVRLGSVSIALDAAHIRWFQAGGPDGESNGLALCELHHKTFLRFVYCQYPLAGQSQSRQGGSSPSTQEPCR